MKRIVIDENLCQGSRLCAATAGEAIAFDADGVAMTNGIPVPDSVADQAESACPSMAITAIGV